MALPPTKSGSKTTELVLAMKDSSIGIEMGLAILFGVLLGQWLDKRFQTSPWLLLLCLGFGIAAAFNAVLRVHRSEQKRAQARRKDTLPQ